jgi:glycosyltransferase involved in cell wall biosynthesis
MSMPQNTLATPFLSVIIPAYNELDNFKRLVLHDVITYLEKQPYSWEIILSDDGSTDGSLAKLKQFADQYPNVQVLANPHRGKGPTVKDGMLAARGEWRLFTDFDQSTPIEEIEKLLPFKNKFDIIIGSREIEGAVRDKEPIHRHLMGKVFNFVVQILAVPGIWDTQCGFKLFSQQAVQTLFPRLFIYGQEQKRQDAFTGAFDVELLYLARKHGFKIKEVPILWRHYQTNRVNPIKDSWRMFKDIVRIRLADLKGKYPLVS